MKTMEAFGKGTGKFVDAYEQEDLNKLRPVLAKAQELWINEWVAQGSTDEGTCTGGKGIQIWYRGPRKRSANPRTVVRGPNVQGNVSAARSNTGALAYLHSLGIDASYYDGWMD
jgi:hypothetical protein